MKSIAVVVLCFLCAASAFDPGTLLTQTQQAITNSLTEARIIWGLLALHFLWEIRYYSSQPQAPQNETSQTETSQPETCKPTSQFVLPLFIAETEHPWVLQHHKLLNLLNSEGHIEVALCTNNPRHPSLVALRQQWPQLIPPTDLFDTIYIGKHEDSRPGYHNMIHRLEELLSCPAALRNVKSLEIDLSLDMAEAAGADYNQTFGVDISKLDASNPRDYSWYQTNITDLNIVLWAHHADGYYDKGRESPFENRTVEEIKTVYNIPPPPSKLSSLLAKVLDPKNTPLLTRLAWDMPCQIAQLVERDLYRNGIGHDRRRLSNIKHLKIGDYVDYMIGLVPNLETLTIGDQGGYIYDPRLSCLWFYEPDGPSAQIRILWAIQDAVANSDTLQKTLTRLDYQGWQPDMNNFLAILPHLPNLQSLTYTGPIRLGPAQPPSPDDWTRTPPHCNPEDPVSPNSPVTQPLRAFLRRIKCHLPHLTSLNLPPHDSLFRLEPNAEDVYAYDYRDHAAIDTRCKPQPQVTGSKHNPYRLKIARTVDLATRVVLDEIPTLREIAYYGLRPVLNTTTATGVSTGKGKVAPRIGRDMDDDADADRGMRLEDVIWPWTGRLYDWAGEE